MRAELLPRMALITALCGLGIAPCRAAAPPCDARAEAALHAARRAYEDGAYRQAATTLEQTLKERPPDARLHHWLGKCYGRIAARSDARNNWFKAVIYSKKTLRQFRRAVQLDAGNRAALRDLISYLEAAPALLGGDTQEAQRLSQRLAALNNEPDEPTAPSGGALPAWAGQCAR